MKRDVIENCANFKEISRKKEICIPAEAALVITLHFLLVQKRFKSVSEVQQLDLGSWWWLIMGLRAK